MPALTELADLHDRADAARHASPLLIAADADARAAMDASLNRTGLLLLGEIHGIRQTYQVIAALVELLDVRTIALEWPTELTAAINAYRHTGVLDDHELLWLGDGRLTPGHLNLLRDLTERQPAVDWLAFDAWELAPEVPGESDWTARDHAMARRVLDHTSPTGRTLVVAGNAHTHTTPIRLGIPMGVWLDRERPGVDNVAIDYGDGAFYNFAPQPLVTHHPVTAYRIHLDHGRLVLHHPSPSEADVPHRPELFPLIDADT